jgi:hypothetical protein
MADQVQVPKLTSYVMTRVPADNVSVTKLVMYAFAVPGDSGPDTTNRQGHVHTQIIRR